MKHRPLLTQVIFAITLILLASLTILKYFEIEGRPWAMAITFPLTIVSFGFVLLYFYLVRKHRRNR
jgi:uncharacterized BrkB/YihY/UPF0761 family membrane protein